MRCLLLGDGLLLVRARRKPIVFAGKKFHRIDQVLGELWGPDQTTILAGRFMECRNPGRWATALVVYAGLLERAGLDVEAQRAATGDWKEPWDYPLKVKKPQKKKASS